MQDVFTEIYEEAVEMNGATFVNAGDAWCYAYDEHPHISLYKSADYHPNDMGAYYTGCVFVSTLFDIQLSDVSETNPYYHMLYGDDAVLLGRAASEFASYYEANGKKPELGSYKAGD